MALLVAGVALFISSLQATRKAGDSSDAARRMERILERRMASLDGYIAQALSQDPAQWMQLENFPQDFVIYRYCADTLQSWCNEFPIINDNINRRVYVPFLVDPRIGVESPLLQVGDSTGFYNLGTRWYLAKTVGDASVRVIAGLQIMDDLPIDGRTLVNPRLRLSRRYAIRPVSESGGTTVSVQGRPQFKVTGEFLSVSRDSSPLVWLALALILTSFLLYFDAERSVRRLSVVAPGVVVLLSGLYFWGKFSRNRILIFSPMLFAGGELLYSLGAVILINLAILVLSVCFYMARKDLVARMGTRGRKLALAVCAVLAVIGILFYSQAALRSIILNSGFSLELYKLAQLSPFSVLVYLSFITMLLSVPLLLELAVPAVSEFTGHRLDPFSLTGRVILSLLVGVYLVTTAAMLGFRKEEDRAELLANRLVFDRDIAMEMRLRRIEAQIADDMILAALSQFQGSDQAVQSRISDYYFAGGERDYLVTARVFNEFNNTRQAAIEYNTTLRDGVPIADNSRFLYIKRDTGRPYYAGVFYYLSEEGTISRVLVRVGLREVRGGRGYAGIFGITPPGQVALPSGYSYARYSDRTLQAYKGRYPYPTRMDDDLYVQMYGARRNHFKMGGYTHFLNVVGESESVVISRTSISPLSYVVAGVLVALLTFLAFSTIVLRRPKAPVFQQSYFKTRISAILLVSLLLTLLVMALVSVLFVYSRNDSNRQSVMSDKINSIIAIMDAGLEGLPSAAQTDWQALRMLVEQVSGETGSDITLYSSDGRMLFSTTAVVSDQLMAQERMNGTAYYNIMYRNRRQYIQQERLGMQKYYSMYAPLFAADDSLVAILCSPYNEETYDFEADAVMHSMSILSLFLLFLLMALFMVSRIVDRMFKPLSEMSGKMDKADLGSLEYIDYDRSDEISSIVQAYNRMVTELSESSRKLAQAERDKAWSGMARQVAHEIKNPLTPMKLQLQRVIRLKQKGDPAWQERFEEASKVILDHIDILTDTANEFSTFAKLYTEEPTEIVLDRLLHEEISMFDNRDNIRFDYLGLSNVVIQGPKPQLTRVFVNLLGNAVQAIGDAPDGRVIVSLRKSVRDGFWDIVVEDNGPGVSEENVERLFTPNFTTKNGGSGLGLAISRSILERCGASISYSRSFTLGGACFTVSYPI
jgi:two-component system nitrogen regulation sensor histidine kinase NtrY